MSRGGQRGRVTLIYILSMPEWARWLRFEPMDDERVCSTPIRDGARCCRLPSDGRDVSSRRAIAWDNADDLIEEYSGFGLRFESRKLGTERAGRVLRVVHLRPGLARPDAGGACRSIRRFPALYRNRMSCTPLLKFAITPADQRRRRREHHRARPLIEGSRCRRRWRTPRSARCDYKQRWGESSTASSTTSTRRSPCAPARRALESDFIYDRYLGEADYSFWQRQARVLVSGMAGGITGEAPLFERFSLGDSRTLRGWDKYDIAPAGGDRMFHASVEYRYPRAWRCSSMPARSGTRARERRVRVLDRLRLHARTGVLHGRLPAQHRRVPRRVHDGLPVRIGVRPASGSTDREPASVAITLALVIRSRSSGSVAALDAQAVTVSARRRRASPCRRRASPSSRASRSRG